MNFRIIWILLCICFLPVGCLPRGEARRVLVIHSYEDYYAGYPEFNRLIEKQFRKEKTKVDIRTLYLDCESYDAAHELERMNRMLDSVSQGWRPEVILVNEDQATYSLLACDHPLVKQTPVVFGGVNYPNQEEIYHYPNVTGFRDRMDIMANIEVVKELFGQEVGLFTILDFTYLDRQIRADVREQLKGQKVFGITDSIRPAGVWQWKAMRQQGYTAFLAVGARVQEAGSSLMWSLRKFYGNQCYLQLKRDFTTINIGNICYKPSLTAINESFGFGERLVGGYITTLPIQVEEEVGAAARILRGVKPADIPMTDSRKEYVVDWKAMSHWNIPIDKIPSHYRIINIPLRDKYPVIWFVAIVAASLSITLLIVWLFLLYRREQKRKKHVQLALADEKQTLSLAIEGGNTYVWKFENESFVFEKAFWVSMGIPAQNLSFEQMLEHIHPDSWPSVLKNWDKTKVRKRIAQMRCDFNGEGYEWWEFRYTTVQLESGEYRTAGLMLNIQDVKDREQELEKARLLAEKAELKESFLANMSHEIRTPLNAIVGFSNILTSGEEIDPEDRRLYIEMINRNNELLLKLVNDILELSRIESGAMSFECTECLVAEFIDNIYLTYSVLIPGKIEFLKQTDSAPLQIYVDPARLMQVIINFLSNATKFTHEGYIKLGYYFIPATKQVCIYVEDTGSGIPQEEQKMIFSRFYKRDEFAQGTGLGLSICKIIVEKLGGSIELESELGKGSRFMVLLPCEVSDPK